VSVVDYIEWFVNRTKQHKRYRQMLANETPMATMLIEAPTGMGKTFLVKKMRYLAEKARHPVVHIDFRTRRPYDTLWLTRYARHQISPLLHNPDEIFSDLNEVVNRFTDMNMVVLRQKNAVATIVQRGQPPREVYVDFRDLEKTMLYLDEPEIRNLCFDLGISYDHLRGVTLRERVNSLIQDSHRLDLLGDLVVWGAEELSSFSWWHEMDQLPAETADASPTTAGGAITDNGGDFQPLGEDAKRLALKQINRAFRKAIADIQQTHRLVFLIDSYEDHTDEAEEWMHQNLVLPLVDRQYSNMLLVIAGQDTPEYNEYKPLIGKTGLAPFTKEHVGEYFGKRNIIEEDIDKIYTYCRGMPGILATMADMASMEEEDDDDW